MTLHATYRPVRPQRPHHARKRATTRPRAGEKSCNQRLSFAAKKPQPRLHCSQQFSTVALTTSSATIAERYAYSAYGAPTVCNASGTDIGASAKDNRLTYTGREWDDELMLYHFRARLYDARVGRFLGRDPIGYVDGHNRYCNFYQISNTDPNGLQMTNPHSPVTESECTEFYNYAMNQCSALPWWRWLLRQECMRTVQEAYEKCIDRVTDHPTTLLNYGRYCGPTRRIKYCINNTPYFPVGEEPVDAMDRACAEHDCCLETFEKWCDYTNHWNCNRRFCDQLFNLDCSATADPKTCELYRHRALLLTCYTLGGPLQLP